MTESPEYPDVFAHLPAERIIREDAHFFAIHDRYPVAHGHLLIISRRQVRHFLDLRPAEQCALGTWISWGENYLYETLSKRPDAFTVGINDGEAAGQTVPRFHLHIIPRYTGDVADPRGGIRFVIPEKGVYWV